MIRQSRAQLVLLLYFFLFSVVFSVVYFRMTVEYGVASLEALTAFSAARPFQYRVLLPLMARAVVRIAPGSPLEGVYLVFTVMSVMAILVAFHFLLGLFLQPTAAAAGAFLILYPMFWNYCLLGIYRYPSDVTSILFFLLGWIALLCRQWKAYYLIFILGTINRETGCFLTVLFAALSWERDNRTWIAGHGLAQFVLWAAIKWLLAQWFAQNTGPCLCEIHLVSNLRSLTQWECNGWIRVGLSFGMLWLLVPAGWRDLPPSVRRAMLVAAPVVTGMMLVANIWEVRVFAELIPILALPAVFGFRRLTEQLRWA